MLEEKNNISNTPKTLEEMFVQEHLELKTMLQTTKDECGALRNALSKVSSELKNLKRILKDYCTPIEVSETTGLPGSGIYIHISTYGWDLEHNPQLKNDAEYLLTFLPKQDTIKSEDKEAATAAEEE